MRELTYNECLEIDGGKLSTVLTGIGVAAIGVACMASATASAPVLVGGLVLYQVGKTVAICGVFED